MGYFPQNDAEWMEVQSLLQQMRSFRLKGSEKTSDVFPITKVKNQTEHFTIRYVVRMGGTSVAYFDDPIRADLVRRALNHYRLTPAGRAWWKKQLNCNP